MKLTIIALAATLTFAVPGCRKSDTPEQPHKHPADVANAWMQLQIRLSRSTTGHNSLVSNRSFGYAGLTLYESVAPGISGSRSLLGQVGGTPVKTIKNPDQYYWPASLNAAMAMSTKLFFGNTSAANIASIDSLETIYSTSFHNEAETKKVQQGIEYGRQIAAAIFEWSKADGAHEPYLHIVDPTYVAPVGEGLWVPTTPNASPVHPRWGSNRSFITGIANITQPGAPTPYSADPKSAFYNMVNELYTISLSLTREDSTIARFWGDQPGNLNVPAHATNILTQLINKKNLDLNAAAAAYALHGIAMNDASITVFKTKYQYNQLRPATYIRTVMMHPQWNTIIPTPPHPEYSAAHAVVSAASAVVLEKIFGMNYAFTDHTYDTTYGSRSYKSFEDYAKEAGRSRLLAGIHYSPSINTGLLQGRQVGNKVVQLLVAY